MADNTGREKELDELVLRNAEQMAFPPTEFEKRALAEVISLPRVTVTRPPAEQLLAAGMLPYQCHVNCSDQAAKDPDQVTRHVSGWLINGSALILHSVVEMHGQWLCLTPQLIQVPPQFEFIPDNLIEWLETDGGDRLPLRRGMMLPDALRKYPEHHIRMTDAFRDLMASGMSASDARKMIDQTLGAEFRKIEEPI